MGEFYSLNKLTAYGVGLFCADGHLSLDKRHLDFTSKDLEQIENFKKAFDKNVKVSVKTRSVKAPKDYHCLRFSDVKLYNFLLKLNVPQQKSRSIGSLKIPTLLFADFLRGLLDGDGSITTYNHNQCKLRQIKIRFYSGSRVFLDWINAMLVKNGLSSGKISYGPRVYCLTFCKRDSLKLISFMYYKEDIISLSRKKNLALNYFKEHLDFQPAKWHNRYT